MSNQTDLIQTEQPRHPADHRLDRRRRLGTMRLAVWEGLPAMIAIGLQQAFFVPFLDALGATKFQTGLGAGLPALMTGLIQLGVPRWIEHIRSYRKVLFWSTFLHGLSFVPIALVVFLKPPFSVWSAAALMAVSACAMGFGAGVWADWMSHIVPRRRRGRYFGRRNRLTMLCQMSAAVLAGLTLDTLGGRVLMIFTLLWTVAFVARAGSSFLFLRHYEPPTIHQQPRRPLAFGDFCQTLPSSVFGRFVLAYSLINLAANFSGPFFTLYMLNDLHMSYMQYTILNQTPALATMLSMVLWGRLCDRIGYVIPMRLQVTVVLGLPLVWIITDNFWLLMGTQVFAGLSWGGLTLTSFNYSLNAIGHQSRLSSLSYLNFLSGLCICLGTTLGGWLGPMLPAFSDSQYHSVFLFSTLLRIVPVVLFQLLPTDQPPKTKMSTLERFFFDPRLGLRMGFDRVIISRFRRPI